MGKSTLEVRNEIERIRRELDETLDELGDHVRPRRIYERKTRRMRGRLHSVRDAVMGTTTHAAAGAAHGVSERAAHLRDDVGGVAGSVAERVREAPELVEERARGNPLAAGIVAFGVGVLLASVLPETEGEQQAAGALASKLEPVKQKALESVQEVRSDVGDAAREAVDHVKEQSQSAVTEVKDEAKVAADSLKDDAKAGAQEVREAGEH